jgi:hypothetical protein
MQGVLQDALESESEILLNKLHKIFKMLKLLFSNKTVNCSCFTAKGTLAAGVVVRVLLFL